MSSFTIFLNELSYACDGLSAADIRGHVLACLEMLRDLKGVRSDVNVFGVPSFSGIVFSNGLHSLGSLLGGDRYKDVWLQIRTWEQASTDFALPPDWSPNGLQRVTAQGQTAAGLLWARRASSFVVSIGVPPDWNSQSIDVIHVTIGEAGVPVETAATVPNLATKAHVQLHRELLERHGRELSASSLVYEGGLFVVRMWFDDHGPPHIHILARRDTNFTMVKYAIETLDVLAGEFPPNMSRRVRDWTNQHREELMCNWHRVRVGQHPIAIID